ncbi:STE20-related kinase adapter protein alpha-like [Anneissia japonica]|uniref:STE20-related kinase adapter protein alpha-like n=1 Tax=Anneissia japonica TaxID=1529436 RepID=UPI0014258301|nr:STE20-related kinase adapter protein alpha-like [Anneissia japonica]
MVVYEPNASHYELLSDIGKACDGAATVYLAQHTPSSTFVAVRKTDLESDKASFANLQHEFHLMRLLQHEHLLCCHCAFVVANELWEVMPLMDYGSAQDIVAANFPDGLGELSIAYILRDVLTALDYIHKMGFIHRSIKSSHILLSQNGRILMTGLSTAVNMVKDGQRLRAVHDFPTHAVKNLPWLAPEILEQNLLGYDTRSDIYSIGITACELANGCIPFSDMVSTKMLLEKINGTTPKLLDATTLGEEQLMSQADSGIDTGMVGNSASSSRHSSNPYTRVFSSQFHQFVDICLLRDPSERPSAAALLTHPFFKQVKKRTSELLTSVLQYLKPITQTEQLLKKVTRPDVRDTAQQLQEMDVTDNWVFD